MYKVVLSLAALTAGLVATAVPVPADAQMRRGHSVSVQGARGHGYTQWRSASRQRGSATISRGLQTNSGGGYEASRSRNYGPGDYSSDRSVQANNGRGVTNSRDASWGDGAYNGSRTIAANDGRTRDRTTSATNNGDGTVSYNSTLTRADGGSRSVSGTVPRP
ncbi:hypothetical protein BH10PSE13_BH10PSE13_22120 [soil metagenome]